MTDVEHMDLAMALAREAQARDEYPVGAVLARGDEVLGKGYNTVNQDHDPTAHAEILAIRAACKATNLHKLPGCTLYTTLYPCPLCEAAIIEVRGPDSPPSSH